MKILVSSMVFYPDHSGIALYSSDFAFFAAERGHEVSVVTGFPFYPSWKKRKEDEGVFFRKEKVKGVTILRGYLFVPLKPRTYKRIIQEISFLFFAFFNFLRGRRQDVIVLFTTPVSLGILGWCYKLLYKSRLVINVQDFQVEAADSLGMLNRFSFLKGLVALERFTYKRSDMVSSISDSMVQIIRDKGVKEEKLFYWPNWIDVNEAAQIGKPGKFRKKFNIPEDKTLIAYAGNVGLKQGLSILIDLAECYVHDESLYFLIIGEGGDLENLKNYFASKKLPNFRFLPFLNAEGYKEMLADVEVIFIAQKKIPKDVYFPSKLLGLMAASKLIFLSADCHSELYKVLKNNQLGLVTEFGNFEQMKQCVEEIREASPKLQEYRENAFNFVQRFDRQFVLENVLKKIESLRS